MDEMDDIVVHQGEGEHGLRQLALLPTAGAGKVGRESDLDEMDELGELDELDEWMNWITS